MYRTVGKFVVKFEPHLSSPSVRLSGEGRGEAGGHGMECLEYSQGHPRTGGQGAGPGIYQYQPGFSDMFGMCTVQLYRA